MIELRDTCGILSGERMDEGEESGCMLLDRHGGNHVSKFTDNDHVRWYEWGFIEECDCGLTLEEIEAGECECVWYGKISKAEAEELIARSEKNRRG
jgi:hypothetical protein